MPHLRGKQTPLGQDEGAGSRATTKGGLTNNNGAKGGKFNSIQTNANPPRTPFNFKYMIVLLIVNILLMAANIFTFFLIMNKLGRERYEIEQSRRVLDYIERKRNEK